MDIKLRKKWIYFQKGPEVNWSNIHIDNVKPFCSIDISKDDGMQEACNWKITQHPLTTKNLQPGKKCNLLDYQLQFIKSYQFAEVNEEERKI